MISLLREGSIALKRWHIGILSVTMVLSLLLCSCSSGKVNIDRKGIHDLYNKAESMGIQAKISAEFPDRVSDYRVTYEYKKNADGVIKIMEPASVNDVTIHIRPDGSKLSFDGACLETGVVNPAGVTPISVLPTLISCWAKGDVSEVETTKRNGSPTLLMVYRSGDMEYRTWFLRENYHPIYAEVMVSGRCVLRVDYEKCRL